MTKQTCPVCGAAAVTTAMDLLECGGCGLAFRAEKYFGTPAYSPGLAGGIYVSAKAALFSGALDFLGTAVPEKGRLLDIGSTIGDQLYDTLPKTVEINCLNLNSKKFKNKQIKFKQGDIRKADYPDNYFDLIACVSTLEHIGVAGRYGSDDQPEGDLRAMGEIKRILKPGGILLATVPYGDKDILPINKLYNKTRIDDLFSGLEIISQEFKKFDKNWHVWLKVGETEAAKTDMASDGWYALCLIKAKKI